MATRPQNTAPQPAYLQAVELTAACDYAAVREAALFAKNWLVSHRLPETDAAGWELAIAEAGNNAVEYVTAEGRALPVRFHLAIGENEVEVQVTDHTPGFELKGDIELPDDESEGGRGLFLIKSLTDELAYLRGRGENRFVLRKRRASTAAIPSLDILELQRRLAETEIALSEMGEELSSSYEGLVAMFRYSAELGKNADLGDFARRLLADVLQLTETDLAVLRVFQGTNLETFLVLPSKDEAALPVLTDLDVSRSVELEAVKTREDIWFGGRQPLAGTDPLHGLAGAHGGFVHAFGAGDQLLGTITLIRRQSHAAFRSAQVNILHTLADFLAIQIVNARLLDERTQSRVTRRELEIAANIQRSLLPVSVPSLPPFSVAASCTNAREVGGDFYDVLRVGEDGLLIFIADVMGKGVPAAFFAAVLRSAVHSMPALYSEPAALLTSVNRTLCDDLSRVDMFVTAQAVFLDVANRRVTAASAGHCPLLLWQPGQPAAQLMDEANVPIGIDIEAEYKEASAPLPPGAAALIYTDGLTEACNPMGEMYGLERLNQSLIAGAAEKKTADTIREAVLADLNAFRAAAPLTDDQTFVVISHNL